MYFGAIAHENQKVSAIQHEHVLMKDTNVFLIIEDINNLCDRSIN